MLLLTLAFVTTSLAMPFTDCTKGKGTVQTTSLELTPNPPQSDRNVTLTMGYIQKKPINDAKCQHVVFKSIIPVAKKEFSFCERKQCPQAAGNYTEVQEHFVNKMIPVGDYRVESSCVNQNKVQVWCTSFNVTLVGDEEF
ncbi:MAG: hypothetical protein EZS28_024238 [Streblomastix strix]|uniref:MD-2-related lipid-recognition domain-containing protein n=1 Tax=Streblomastix strix TaxID=222440 RepID=A0A5J4VCF0_9EUKA|nr:MAG: hypothetical protein EZS28_024238 [Streblomastix strix]